MKFTTLRGGRPRRTNSQATLAAQMRSFLAGYDTGAALLHSLYDDVLDEPVPERLRAVLKP